jgi:hypothetical protein
MDPERDAPREWLVTAALTLDHGLHGHLELPAGTRLRYESRRIQDGYWNGPWHSVTRTLLVVQGAHEGKLVSHTESFGDDVHAISAWPPAGLEPVSD